MHVAAKCDRLAVFISHGVRRMRFAQNFYLAAIWTKAFDVILNHQSVDWVLAPLAPEEVLIVAAEHGRKRAGAEDVERGGFAIIVHLDRGARPVGQGDPRPSGGDLHDEIPPAELVSEHLRQVRSGDYSFLRLGPQMDGFRVASDLRRRQGRFRWPSSFTRR